MKTLNLPPYAPTLIESTRALGYSLESAVADIIDNSVAATAKNIDIFFFPKGEAYMAILDDGHGMNSNEITSAMQYGSKSPLDLRDSKDLGRFGLGLKTASLSQCRVLTVISKQGKNIEARRWDIDHVINEGTWSLLVLEKNEIKKVPHLEELLKYKNGTLIIWQKLDRLNLGERRFEESFGRKMDEVRKHLSLVYHRYLSGEQGLQKINIKINGRKIRPRDPFLLEKSSQIMDDESIWINGEEIIVRPYLLPHISNLSPEEIEELGDKEGLRKNQGFYIYRNKRLLVWGTWFRMLRKGEMSKLARIQVDIPNTLDDLWTLDIKKSSAIPPTEVKENLRSIISKIAEKSKRTWTFRGKRETREDITHIWNRLKTREGGYIYEINRKSILVEKMIKDHPELKTQLNILLNQIEKGLPLNSLYLDLSNDRKIENDKNFLFEDVSPIVQYLLETTPPGQRKSRIESIIHNEPFNDFILEIRKMLEEG